MEHPDHYKADSCSPSDHYSDGRCGEKAEPEQDSGFGSHRDQEIEKGRMGDLEQNDSGQETLIGVKGREIAKTQEQVEENDETEGNSQSAQSTKIEFEAEESPHQLRGPTSE